MNNSQFENISKFFMDFLNEYGNDEIVSAFEEESIQQQLADLVKAGEKKSRVTKKSKKDPNKPKKRSAYIIFGTKVREYIKNENPDIKNTEIMKEQARLWKTLSKDNPALLEECKNEAEEEKRAYDIAMQTYVSSEEPEVKKRKSKKDPKKPKARLTMWTAYQKMIRPILKVEEPNMKPQDVMKEISVRWNNFLEILDDETHKKYQEFKRIKDELQEKVNEDLERFNREKEEMSTSSSETEPETQAKVPRPQRIRRIPDMADVIKMVCEMDVEDQINEVQNSEDTKTEDEEEEEAPAPKEVAKKAPKKPAAHIIFYRENKDRFKKENPDLSAKEIQSLISAAWKNLSKEEKQVYKNKAA